MEDDKRMISKPPSSDDTSAQLTSWGWADFFEDQTSTGLFEDTIPARIIDEQRGRYGLATSSMDQGPVFGLLSGSLERYPVIGDWVLYRPESQGGDGLIRTILEPKTILKRSSVDSKRRSGAARERLLAANVDIVLAACSLDLDFSLRRLERYLTLAWDGGAKPMVVLTKTDLCPGFKDLETEATLALPGVEVISISIKTGQGLERLAGLLKPGLTSVLVGSSGVGKSSLINRLAGDELMAVGRVRTGDGKGRHTTTHRRLIKLPSGAMIIDTPGLRALGLTEAETGLAQTFGDILDLARDCRFSDCGHQSEPGCAVTRAVEEKRLDPDRLSNYQTLKKESRSRAQAADPKARKKAGRQMSRMVKEAKRAKKFKDRY